MLNEGYYLARLTSVYMGRARGGKRSPLIEWVWQIHSRATDNRWVPLDQPAERRCGLFLTQDAMPYTVAKLESMQFTGDVTNPQVEDFPRGYWAPDSDGIILYCQHVRSSSDATKTVEDWRPKTWIDLLNNPDGNKRNEPRVTPLEDQERDLVRAYFNAAKSSSEIQRAPVAAVPANNGHTFTPPLPTDADAPWERPTR